MRPNGEPYREPHHTPAVLLTAAQTINSGLALFVPHRQVGGIKRLPIGRPRQSCYSLSYRCFFCGSGRRTGDDHNHDGRHRNRYGQGVLPVVAHKHQDQFCVRVQWRADDSTAQAYAHHQRVQAKPAGILSASETATTQSLSASGWGQLRQMGATTRVTASALAALRMPASSRMQGAA